MTCQPDRALATVLERSRHEVLVVRLRQKQDRLPVMRFMDAGSEPLP